MAPTNNSTTWVVPRTWTAGELVTASIMNAHVRDNLNALKTPAGGYNVLNLGADLTTTGTSFADMDATNLILTFTTAGGDVILFFTGSMLGGAIAQSTFIDIHESVAGTRLGGDDGLLQIVYATALNVVPVTLCYRATGLSAASHAFKMQWKVAAGTATLYAGAGTATHDLHPSFFAFEI
jgi:hypothetical protein